MSNHASLPLSVSHIVNAIEALVSQSQQDLEANLSPRILYEHSVAAVESKIERAFELLSSGVDQADQSNLRTQIVNYGGQLKELQYQHENNFAETDAKYQEQQKEIFRKLCVDIVTTLGVQALQDAIRSIQSQTPPPLRRANARVAANKRKQTEQLDAPDHGKRRRPNHAQSDASVIEFDQVFGKGSAAKKRTIVQHPKGTGSWYILRCEEHEIDFNGKPLLRGGAHLASREHGQASRQSDNVIAQFGIKVLNCTEALAAKNNDVAHSSLGKSSNHTQLVEGPQASKARLKRGQWTPMVDPIPGEVYCGFWGKSKSSWAVLLLPTDDDLGTVGVPGTMESLGLTYSIPKCYDYDERTSTFSWAEGYEDGGPHIAKREFPIMYFDGLSFPEKSSVGWLGAKDLVTLHEDSPLITSEDPIARLVKEYLRKQQVDSTSEMDLDECELPDAADRPEDSNCTSPQRDIQHGSDTSVHDADTPSTHRGESLLQIENAPSTPTSRENNSTKGECTATSQVPETASVPLDSSVPADDRVCLPEVIDLTLPGPSISERNPSQYVSESDPRVHTIPFEYPPVSAQDSTPSLMDIARESLNQQPVVRSLPQSGPNPSAPCTEVPAILHVESHSHNRNAIQDQGQHVNSAPIGHSHEGAARLLPLAPKLYGNDTFAPRPAITTTMAPMEPQQRMWLNSPNQPHYETVARQGPLLGDQLHTPTSLPSVQSPGYSGDMASRALLGILVPSPAPPQGAFVQDAAGHARTQTGSVPQSYYGPQHPNMPPSFLPTINTGNGRPPRWSTELPDSISDRLVSYLASKRLPIHENSFRNPRGVLVCPFCSKCPHPEDRYFFQHLRMKHS